MRSDRGCEIRSIPDWQAPFGKTLELDGDFARYIMGAVGQGLLVTGKDWRFEYVNPAFARMVSCSSQNLVGKSMDDFIHRDDLEILKEARKKRLAGETSSYEVRLVGSDGLIVFVQITGAPRWQEDKVVGSVTVIANLTGHHIAEQERRVYERTAELARSNELLLAEVIERRRAEERLNTSLKERETLLREIHHKVQNNLQVISCLLYLQSKRAVDERPSDILQDCQNRVKSMAMVHEKLCKSQDLTKVNLDEYVKSLVDYLFRYYNVHPDRISLKFDIDKITIGIDTAVSCGFVINELISNSLKHAFPGDRKGEICIEFRSDGEKGFRMVIKDDGIGFKTNLARANTLGLQLVSTIVKQIDGSIKLESNRGTRLEIAFLEPAYREQR